MFLNMRKSITLLLLMLGLGMGASAVKGQLMITEIMYRSPIGGNQDSLEFIELYNYSDAPVNLSGWSFSMGINHSFTNGILNPGEFVIACKNGPSFLDYFGTPCQIDTWFLGSLLDAGEAVVLKNPQMVTVDSVFYSPNAPWPTIGNGDGHSINYCNRTLDNQDGTMWSGATSLVPGAICQGTQIFANPGACCDYSDGTPPTILSASAFNLNKVGILFSEPISNSSLWVSNFIVNAGVASVSYGATQDSLVLTLTSPLTNGIYDTVFVSGVQDTACNSMLTTSFPIVNNYLTTQFPLIFSEILYDDPSQNDSLEFIEVMSVNPQAVVMGGLRITGSIEFQFPEYELLTEKRVIVARYPEVIERIFRPSCPVFGWNSGTLGDTGGHLEIWNTAMIVDSMSYSNTSPWPTNANGTGHSITLCVEPVDDADPASWFLSTQADWTAVFNSDTIYATLCNLGCRTVGIENAIVYQAQIHPNPFTTTFEIQTEADAITQATVRDAIGRVVLQAPLDNGYAKIELGNSPAGVYFVNLQAADGSVLAVRKLIRL